MRTPGAMSRRRFIALAGGTGFMAAGGASLLAACGSDGGSSSGAASSGTATTAVVPTTVIDPDVPWRLQGNFAPVTREVEADDLVVRGELPESLDGLYVRNGSNAQNADNGHWFLGDGMLHGIRLVSEP